MKISSFEWDEHNEEHITRHGAEPEETEEVFAGNPVIYKARHSRYYALGQTEDGFPLTVVFEHLGKGKARIVTARPMSFKEQNRHGQPKWAAPVNENRHP